MSKRDGAAPANALKSAVNVLGLPISAESAIAEAKEAAETYAIKQTTGCVSEPEARLVYLVDEVGAGGLVDGGGGGQSGRGFGVGAALRFYLGGHSS